MCGRYGRRADKQYIAENYRIRRVEYDDMREELPYAFTPNYNIAPADAVSVMPYLRPVQNKSMS